MTIHTCDRCITHPISDSNLLEIVKSFSNDLQSEWTIQQLKLKELYKKIINIVDDKQPNKTNQNVYSFASDISFDGKEDELVYEKSIEMIMNELIQQITKLLGPWKPPRFKTFQNPYMNELTVERSANIDCNVLICSHVNKICVTIQVYIFSVDMEY